MPSTPRPSIGNLKVHAKGKRKIREIREIRDPKNLRAIRDPESFVISVFPLLQDVIDAPEEPLDDWAAFLIDWHSALGIGVGDRAQILLLEATSLLKGPEGVAALARKWGDRQPRGYLFWLDLLTASDQSGEAVEVCLEALEQISHYHFRLQLSEILIVSARRAGNPEMAIRGAREKFLAEPRTRNLLNLVLELKQPERIHQELESLLPGLTDREALTLRAKALLLAGKIDAGFLLREKCSPLGWSSERNPAGLLFASILLALTPRDSPRPAMKLVLRRYADLGEWGYECVEKSAGPAQESPRLSDFILRELEAFEVSPVDMDPLFEWAKKIGARRVDEILKNQHRSAYERAAEVVAALAEYHVSLGDAPKAGQVLYEFRNQKYSRFRAFRSELDAVCKKSGLDPLISRR